jgi:hypothetical protein
MYITHANTVWVDAMREAVGSVNHPTLGGKKVWVGMSYPNKETNYPGLWCEFTPGPTVQAAGVGHVEYRHPDTDDIRRGTRWRFSGTLTTTVVSLSKTERDDLLDEVLRFIAFGAEHPQTAVLRQRVESDGLIAMSVQWDKANITGLMESPGTPWGTNDLLCEGTVSLSCEGEFISDLASQISLVPLERVDFPEISLDRGQDPLFPLTQGQTGWQ